MKKKSLKSLKLNKKSISNLQGETVVGASSGCLPLTKWIIGTVISIVGDCDDSADGCTGTPDETMTCADWSCACQ
jgi:hypothetical protein